MKRNFKIMISALSVMFIMAIAVTILTFSYANNDDVNGEITDEGQIILADYDIADEYTNIDNIIMNSKATYTDADPIYRIVEIGSSDTPSTLKDFVESKGFEELVLNSHATIDDVMEADCIEYNYFSASSVTNDSADALSVISNADFIYVSHDITSEYSASNDLCEELYNILHTYAVGSYKPLVIDSPAAKASSGNGGNTNPSTGQPYSMGSLAGDVFAPTGKYYNTFAWDQTLSAEDFLAHKSGSMYLGINGTQKSKTNWVTLIDDETNPEEPADYKMAKFLTISASGSSTMTDKLLDSTKIIDNTTTKLKYGDGSPLTGVVYDIKDTLVATSAYNRRYNVPDYVELTKVSLADLSTSDISFDEYDMIIIESDCAGSAITADLYKKFSAAMLGNLTIVYDKAMESATTTTPDEPEMPSITNSSNYLELYYMVATSSNMSRYQNVMITDREQFSIITSSNSAATAKVIADLINASSYRGMGGPTSTSNMFTVLEIQPCYPIDEALAEEIGKTNPRTAENQYANVYGSANYYTVPDQVVDNRTKEELEEGTEYYAWELSKAKIADITGLSVDQINLVHMSSEELASNKESILGTYDLVYVGGNNSALKDADEYVGLIRFARAGGTYKSNGITDPSMLAKLPVYTTYSHSGDFVNASVATYGGVVSDAQHAASRVVINGEAKSNSVAVLNGNDITYNNLKDLLDYASAGMPIVFSKDASGAYYDAKNNGYIQNSLDPDSNMFKFMDACMTRTNNADLKTKNVLWDFDQSMVVRADNNAGRLGNTLTGYVYVFAGEHNGRTEDFIDQSQVTGDNQKLFDLLAGSNKRPKLTITKSPAIYNMYDESSKITDGRLNFEYRVSTMSNYTVTLYIDDNANSKFSVDEMVTTGDKTKLNYKADASFYGPVYWKLEVADSLGMTTSQTGISYINNPNPEKQTVRVLQIMPNPQEMGIGYAPAQDPNALFLCTTCQKAYHRLDWNPTLTSGDLYEFNAVYDGHYEDIEGGKAYQGDVYLGRHDHDFGIVSYDSNKPLPYDAGEAITKYGTTGMDDWDNNLADEVSDIFGFDLDILYRKEFEDASNEVVSAYDFSGMSENDKQKMIDEYDIDENSSDYAVYSEYLAAGDTNALLKFITQKSYEEEASKYWQLYQYMSTQKVATNPNFKDENNVVITATTLDQEEILVSKIKQMIDGVDDASGTYTFSYSPERTKSELQRLIDTKKYWEFYALDNGKAAAHDVASSYLGEDFYQYYEAYVLAKDKELEYRDLYKKYDRLAHPDNWLSGCYDAVVLGPSEDFAGDDITNQYALADLADFIDNGGTLLLFHDTLTKFTDKGSVQLTSSLKERFGVDRYHMEVDENFIGDEKTVTSDNVVPGSLSVNINNYSYQIDSLPTNTQYVNITATRDNNGNMSYSHTLEGTLPNAGNIEFRFTCKDVAGNPISGNTFTVNAVQYYPTTYNRTVSGTTGDDGLVSVAIPNYITQTTTYTPEDIYYLPYKTTREPEKYFMSNLSSRTGDEKYYTWISDFKQIYSGVGNNYLSDVAFTDVVAVSDEAFNSLALPYKYADIKWNIFVHWDQDAKFNNRTHPDYGSNRASQNNKGIITLFPFTLSDELNISGTHSQAYALDIEDDDMTVWYSLAASPNAKAGSSVFAASPRDGMDNYFIYSYGNVHYCGAGHSKVTGVFKDNNDERKLYINILCNSVRKSVMQPAIYIYDYQKDTYGDKIKMDVNGEYYTKVDSTESYPQFSFKVNVDAGASLQNVRIYYDLDYSVDNPSYAYVDNDKHKLIADWDKSYVTAGVTKDVFRYDATLKKMYDDSGNQIMEKYVDETGTEVDVAATMLKLQPEYFEAYNNEYTYLVIEATDSKGQKVYQRIKINLKDKLFNLT